MADEYTRELGKHIRSLRKARGLTQELLAKRSALSPDTVRRMEHGSFSPTIHTLRKLCTGLKLQLSTLFASLELGCSDERRELLDFLSGRSPAQLARLARIMRFLADECAGLAEENDGGD